MSKPSGGIRSFLAVRLGLPTPIVALACICDVDIRVFSGAGCQLYFYGVCKFICLSSFMYNRFHKELRFFFSLLKRKKEAKKEKSSHSTCTIRSSITRRLHVAKIPRRGKQAAAAAVTLPFSRLKLGRRVSGGLLSLSKSAVAISAGRRADSPRKKKRIRIPPVLYGKCIARSAALLYFNVTNELEATPHKERLATLHAICLQISRHISQKCS